MASKMHTNGVRAEVRTEGMKPRANHTHQRMPAHAPRKPQEGLWPYAAKLAPFIPSPPKGMRWERGKLVTRTYR